LIMNLKINDILIISYVTGTHTHLLHDLQGI
jgi:hypothetical protein